MYIDASSSKQVRACAFASCFCSPPVNCRFRRHHPSRSGLIDRSKSSLLPHLNDASVVIRMSISYMQSMRVSINDTFKYEPTYSLMSCFAVCSPVSTYNKSQIWSRRVYKNMMPLYNPNNGASLPSMLCIQVLIGLPMMRIKYEEHLNEGTRLVSRVCSTFRCSQLLLRVRFVARCLICK